MERSRKVADRISETPPYAGCGLHRAAIPSARHRRLYQPRGVDCFGYDKCDDAGRIRPTAIGICTSAPRYGSATASASPIHEHVGRFRGIRHDRLKMRPSLKADELCAARHHQIRNGGPEGSFDKPLWRRQGGRALPTMVRRVEARGRAVVWSCDPMPRPQLTEESGYKEAAVPTEPAGVKNPLFAVQRSGRHPWRGGAGDVRKGRHRMHRAGRVQISDQD